MGCNDQLCMYVCETKKGVVNYTCKSLDERQSGVAGIFYDFSKAFDLIDHDILLEKRKFYGFQGRDRLLLKSYLTNRRQFVNIGLIKVGHGEL